MRKAVIGILALICIICGCNSRSETKTFGASQLVGNWLIIFPDHNGLSRSERELYGPHQDSLIKIFGLKMIRFEEDSSFKEIDSVENNGLWSFSTDSTLEVNGAGKGFQQFIGKLESLENDTLRVSELVSIEKRPLKITWHMKKINAGDDAYHLFEPASNQWRKKPRSPESDTAMKKRLAQILKYYSAYYKLVGRESIYFSPAKVPFPFRYYGGGMGMDTELRPDFVNLFYNAQDSEKAWVILDEVMRALEDQYPNATNFTLEYAGFMEKMALKLEKQ